ncbi:MAG: hypothetical protein ACLVO2_16410 [Clostridia bacterium]
MQCSGKAEKPVSGRVYLKERGWEMAGKRGKKSCSGGTKRWRYDTSCNTGTGRDSRSDDGISLSNGTGVKGVRPMKV